MQFWRRSIKAWITRKEHKWKGMKHVKTDEMCIYKFMKNIIKNSL